MCIFHLQHIQIQTGHISMDQSVKTQNPTHLCYLVPGQSITYLSS